jgi:hypothetical protein
MSLASPPHRARAPGVPGSRPQQGGWQEVDEAAGSRRAGGADTSWYEVVVNNQAFWCRLGHPDSPAMRIRRVPSAALTSSDPAATAGQAAYQLDALRAP